MSTRTLLLALALSACGSSDGAGGGGTLTVTWKLLDVDGSSASCDPAFGTMQITTNAFDTDGTEDGSPQTTSFDCAAGMGVIDLAGGDDLSGMYAVEWAETDSTGENIFMTDAVSQVADVPLMVDVSSGAATASTTMYPTGGWVWTEWTLEGMQSGTTIGTCADAGVDHVEVTITDTATSVATTVMAGCDAVAADIPLSFPDTVGSIVSPAAPGDYALSVTAFDASGQVVGMSSGTGNDSATVTAPNKISTIAGRLTIDVDGL